MATIESFNIANQSNNDLRKKLKKVEQVRRSADLALEGTQKQAKDAMSLLWFQNVTGVRNGLSWIAKQLPKDDPQ